MRLTIILTLVFFFTVSAQVDSLSLKNSGYPYKRMERKHSTKGQAVIWSVFVPGGGHFYLGNRKTGIAYAVTRLLIIPGIALMVDSNSLSIMGVVESKTEAGFGAAFLSIGLASWAVDIIHAGYSAKHSDPVIYEDNNKLIGFDIKTDIENKRYGLELTYTFK